MSRSQNFQELFLQILVAFFSWHSLSTLSHRPMLNKTLALSALLVGLVAVMVHLGNWLLGAKYFQPKPQVQTQKLWKFFLLSLMIFFGLTVWSLFPGVGPWASAAFYLFPLIFLYPIYFFYQHRWYPRVFLLVAVLFMTYSHMALLRNDRLHLKMTMMVRSPKGFQPAIVDEFDRQSLTASQANDVAWLLSTHPDESLRDYSKAIEFAQLGLKAARHTQDRRNLADTLVCAHLGLKDKQAAEVLIKDFALTHREVLLGSDEPCESTIRTRAPASVRKRKYKYYF